MKKIIHILFFLSSVLFAGNSPIIWGPGCAFNLVTNTCLPTSSSPAFTGIPTAPTASLGTNTTQIATTAFVLGQGFLTSTGSIPTGSIDNATPATSATTTFVNALTTSVILTQTAQIFAAANANFTTTTAASVAGMRITVNGTASRTALLTLTALATNYMGTVQYTSAALPPGTYTVNFDFQRSSGTGTVNYASGTLNATGLQGANSNGITQLTGDVTAGPGSGSQVATIPAASISNAKISTTAAIAYSKLAALTTGQILVGNAGVPTATTLGGDATIGATGTLTIANSAITNAKVLNVDASKITTGTLAMARGGTGTTSFATQRIPFGTGSALATDANFIYDTATNRFTVGGSGNASVGAVVTTGSNIGVQSFCSSTNNCMQIRNQNAYNLAMLNANDANVLGVLVGAERSRGTQASRTQALSGDIGLNLVGSCYTGSGSSAGFTAAMQYVQSENCTGSANGGEIVFSSTLNGTTTLVERARITNDGLAKFKQGVTMDTAGVQPTCDSGHRGTFWVIQGGIGVADILQVCLKDASNNYNWVTK